MRKALERELYLIMELERLLEDLYREFLIFNSEDLYPFLMERYSNINVRFRFTLRFYISSRAEKVPVTKIMKDITDVLSYSDLHKLEAELKSEEESND